MVRNGLMWCVFLKVEWKGHGDGYRLRRLEGWAVSEPRVLFCTWQVGGDC